MPIIRGSMLQLVRWPLVLHDDNPPSNIDDDNDEPGLLRRPPLPRLENETIERFLFTGRSLYLASVAHNEITT